MFPSARTGAALAILCWLGGAWAAWAQIKERFPKPDFQSGYIRPDLQTPAPRSMAWEMADIAVLAAALAAATYLAHRTRSRRSIFLLMIFSLLYFGFFREGCVCPVGSVQNVFLALFTPGYAVPFTVIAFFLLPLAFALLFGRTFCAAVCPLGMMQDVVILKPVRIPGRLADILGAIPYIYLTLTLLFAATGATFLTCRLDPFVGFFRFGATFPLVLFGISMLVLGTVVARPYCRFLCPYGVLLDWMSKLSWRHVKITPGECNNCRLCEDSCPFGAIRTPVLESPPPVGRMEVRRLAMQFLLLPAVVLAAGWAGAELHLVLARMHPVVSLAEEVLAHDAGKSGEVSDPVKAYRASGKPLAELLSEADALQGRFRTGGWLAGGFLGLAFAWKRIHLLVRRKSPWYDLDRGACFSCGRCFSYCPYEKVRLGLIPPDAVPEPPENNNLNGKNHA